VIAAAFPFSTMGWVMLWVVPALIVAMAVVLKAKFSEDEVHDLQSAIAVRMRTRILMGMIALPALLIAIFLEEPARDAWNARYGICAGLLPPEAAKELVGVEGVPSIYEGESSCFVGYEERFGGRERVRLNVQTYAGTQSSAFAYAVDKLRGKPVILELPWPRSYTIVRKTVDQTVLLLELRHGAVLSVDLYQPIENEALWSLVEGLAEREDLTEPLLSAAAR